MSIYVFSLRYQYLDLSISSLSAFIIVVCYTLMFFVIRTSANYVGLTFITSRSVLLTLRTLTHKVGRINMKIPFGPSIQTLSGDICTNNLRQVFVILRGVPN